MPKDPMMLMSFINMKLRDFYPTLDALCDDMDVDRQELENKMAEAGLEYNAAANKFGNTQTQCNYRKRPPPCCDSDGGDVHFLSLQEWGGLFVRIPVKSFIPFEDVHFYLAQIKFDFGPQFVETLFEMEHIRALPVIFGIMSPSLFSFQFFSISCSALRVLSIMANVSCAARSSMLSITIMPVARALKAVGKVSRMARILSLAA